jgi:hypothetical protein
MYSPALELQSTERAPASSLAAVEHKGAFTGRVGYAHPTAAPDDRQDPECPFRVDSADWLRCGNRTFVYSQKPPIPGDFQDEATCSGPLEKGAILKTMSRNMSLDRRPWG